MVSRSTKTARASRRAPARRPATRVAPATVTPPVSVQQVTARLARAGRALRRAGMAAQQFARSSVREVSLAGRAAREPMHEVWRAARLAARHIARDAIAAWHEAVPMLARARKPSHPHTA